MTRSEMIVLQEALKKLPKCYKVLLTTTSSNRIGQLIHYETDFFVDLNDQLEMSLDDPLNTNLV